MSEKNFTNKKYAAVVVLYQPDKRVISNIKSYSDELEKIYMIDNSESLDEELLRELKNYNYIQYVKNNVNVGLADALNKGCQMAFADDIDYVFTMDQDSIFQNNSVATMKMYMETHQEKIIIAPYIVPYYDPADLESLVIPVNKTEKVDFAITSGTLVSKNAYEDVKGFDAGLFIEHIDVDFCIKLSIMGWELRKIANTVLYQRVGNSEPRRFLWRIIHPLFADPVRGYYKVRNSKYLYKKYGRRLYKYTPRLYEAVIKTLLYEPQKMIRCKYYLKGYIAGLRGQMGKFVN